MAVGPVKNFDFFIDFAKSNLPKHCFLVVFSARTDDQSKERTNLPGVTLFDFCRIFCRSGGKEGVPPRQFHSGSSVAYRYSSLLRN